MYYCLFYLVKLPKRATIVQPGSNIFPTTFVLRPQSFWTVLMQWMCARGYLLQVPLITIFKCGDNRVDVCTLLSSPFAPASD